jgi:hypothetical protein
MSLPEEAQLQIEFGEIPSACKIASTTTVRYLSPGFRPQFSTRLPPRKLNFAVPD